MKTWRLICLLSGCGMLLGAVRVAASAESAPAHPAPESRQEAVHDKEGADVAPKNEDYSAEEKLVHSRQSGHDSKERQSGGSLKVAPKSPFHAQKESIQSSKRPEPPAARRASRAVTQKKMAVEHTFAAHSPSISPLGRPELASARLRGPEPESLGGRPRSVPPPQPSLAEPLLHKNAHQNEPSS